MVLDFRFGLGPFFLTRSDLGWVWVPKENDWVNPVQPENIKKIKKLKLKGPKSKPNLQSCLVSHQSPSSSPNPNPNVTLQNLIITSLVKEISLVLGNRLRLEGNASLSASYKGNHCLKYVILNKLF